MPAPIDGSSSAASAERTFPIEPFAISFVPNTCSPILAHALITEVAIDCGYPASSIRERIYISADLGTPPQRCGILIYTASAGNQGTLGGLVEVSRRFAQVLENALERQRLCSGDPVCADHDPATAADDRTLHGAACHGCLVIAETSCEARNLFLDRALLSSIRWDRPA